MPHSTGVLTVTESISVVDLGGPAKPTIAETGFDLQISLEEEPFVKRYLLTEAWSPIKHCWLEQASLVVIKNETGMSIQRRPSAEELIATQAAIVEVTLSHPNLATDPNGGEGLTWLIPPGWSMRGKPGRVKNLLLRSQTGQANVLVYVFPK